MIVLIVGQAGAELLERLKFYRPWILSYDLSILLEEIEGLSIAQILRQKGTDYLQGLQVEIFERVVPKLHRRSQEQENCEIFFNIGEALIERIPSDLPILRARTIHEVVGESSKKRSQEVQEWETWTLPAFPNHAEEDFFSGSADLSGTAITLRSKNFRSKEMLKYFINRRLQMSVCFFEVRDDLVEKRDLSMALEFIPADKILMSFRPNANYQVPPLNGIRFDWDISLGAPPKGATPYMISTHTLLSEGVAATLQYLEDYHRQNNLSAATLLKAALEIRDLADLVILREWMSHNPATRIALPITESGRMGWFRLWMKGRMPFQFIREDDGALPDQPLLNEWLSVPRDAYDFAAHLCESSTTNAEVIEDFIAFQKKEIPHFRIRVKKGAVAKELQTLLNFGLRWASVDRSLEAEAFAATDFKSQKACRDERVNLLRCDNGVNIHGSYMHTTGSGARMIYWNI